MLGQHVDVVLVSLGLGPELDLNERLVDEAGGPDVARVALPKQATQATFLATVISVPRRMALTSDS